LYGKQELSEQILLDLSNGIFFDFGAAIVGYPTIFFSSDMGSGNLF
jgi:hypothetical protein